jgi:hypothetical protein
MSSENKQLGDDVGRDPYFTAYVVGLAKPSRARADESVRRTRQFGSRTKFMAILVAGVWIGIFLLDPQAELLVACLAGGVGVGLTVMGAAMGLGFLGFGLFAAADRLLGAIRHASHWPDE